MSEMVYKTERTEAEYLETGEIDGYKFAAVSYGTHPCCYVQLPTYHRLYGKLNEEDIELDVHGGITYARYNQDFDFFDRGKHVIGWDYAHLNDYMGFYKNTDTPAFYRTKELKKWTLKELLQHIEYAIEQLKGMNNERHYRQI